MNETHRLGWIVLFVAGTLFATVAQAEVVRSNGKGGGMWSAASTWQGGKVPSGESVVILTKDVVEMDAAAGSEVRCEELTIDPQGLLRVLGKNKTILNVIIGKSLNVFGGMLVDFSGDPEGRCEFRWDPAEGIAPEINFGEGCKVLWKGAVGDIPNVAFRIATTNGLPANTPPPGPVPLTLGPKMSIECERVLLEGFEVQARGMDGSGMKFNERCSFRHCHFIRSPVFFQSCKKIEFEGNTLREGTTHGLYLNGVTGSRIVSNLVENMVGSSVAGICCAYGVSDCELTGNTVRRCSIGILLVVCSDMLLSNNRIEQTETAGMMLNTCQRIITRRTTFTSNAQLDIRAIYDGVIEPWKFYDCVFQDPPTNANTASISVEGQVPVEIINSPLQTYLKDGKRGPLTFSAYVDICVTNAQGEALGRIPLRVLSGGKVVATSRTEAVGAWTGHTPPFSSHRPLVLPWYRFAPAEGLTNPSGSIPYQVEADGTALGYEKQTVPLIMDAGHLRPDPEKPAKTLSVKLTKAK